MTLARNIMESHVVTVTPETPLLSVHRLFAQEDISGAPVVDQLGEVVGVISWRDLMRAANEEHDQSTDELHYYSDNGSLEPPEWLSDIEAFEDRLSRRTVAEVMTNGVISVPIDASVKEMAALMVEHHIHRVLVLDEERDEGPLAGIVSVFDLVTLLAK
jgi:CBS domain-containing protein